MAIHNPPVVTMKAVFGSEVIFGCLMSVYLAENGLFWLFSAEKFSAPNFFEPIVKIVPLIYHTRINEALEVVRRLSVDNIFAADC